MKWTLFIQQKTKVAMLLFCIMLFAILTSVIGGRNLDNINYSVKSIYNDRLIPATDLYYISDNLHSKKALLESALNNSENVTATHQQLKYINASISKLITQFEGTYLVKSEPEFIDQLKHNNKLLTVAEASIIRLLAANQHAEAHAVYDQNVLNTHKNSITLLSKLINIQSAVGKDLIKQSAFNASSFNLLSTLQILVSVIIGMLIIKLVIASKLNNTVYKKYNMN
ncbi:hypothetical protein GCM10023149_18950 [Mucilaginibacter gynuensis]|uniref:Chemotaxis methyl-accepting receptor HlyB-like 4HB MCP domain-containing protein n=1 Tax=Mucilaginibacter gynuensis TaxID=1302236 RepID=A0ABP8G9B7_9SPHI